MCLKSWSFFLCVQIALVSCLGSDPRSQGSSKPEYNYQLPGWSPVEQYLTLKLDNFTSWMTTRAPEELPGVEVLPLANYSDNLAISNRFYKLDLTFTEPPTLTGFASRVRPRCVNADLERGQITVGYSAYNVVISGHYKAQGRILNETRFTGGGLRRLGMQLGCVLEARFSYGNGSRVTLEEDGQDFRFYCRRGAYLEEDDSPKFRDPFRCEYRIRSRVIYSRFDGLFNSTDGRVPREELEGVQALIQASVGRHLKKEVDHSVILQSAVGGRLYRQLRDVIQEKSVWAMLNFEQGDYFKSRAPILVVGF